MLTTNFQINNFNKCLQCYIFIEILMHALLKYIIRGKKGKEKEKKNRKTVKIIVINRLIMKTKCNQGARFFFIFIAIIQ